ncbi:MAG: phosphoribosylglycinamide formyltransferase, partial [Clostridia bacterium]|nr:phosphoribosylglycinamide formyltransferase [Clostridia bacterium]
MLNIAVLVSGGGTNLQALIDSEIKNGKIVKVVSSKSGAYALERAKNAGIETAVVERKAHTKESFEEAILKELEGIDLIVLAGFMCVLSENFIRKFEERIINVHPSLIPSFCGDG